MSIYPWAIFLLFHTALCQGQQAKLWVSYEGSQGPGRGRHIVLISGDEEYRSEESLPMLGKILAQRHGFTCTVVFAVDPNTGEIDPFYLSNIPGLENLQQADLLLIAARFRELPDAQMQYIDRYLKAGKPVIGLRTATHAFYYQNNPDNPFAKYSFDSMMKGWEGGFGNIVLGETWIAHHGEHGKEGTRGLINGVQQLAKNPILNGVQNIWVPSDVYAIRNSGAQWNVLVYGQPTRGMTPSSPVNLDKSAMPVAWTKSYTIESGNTGRVFTTTMGASIDMLNEDLRRMIVNACYWAVGLESSIPEKADVGFIGEYKPNMFGFGSFIKGMRPEKHALK